jgi:polyhydroxyalkanoate synthesis repressor PhaR
MLIIKRYPNRKLYNTQTKKYITLSEIAQIIRQGTDIQVIDYNSGEDLTVLTLSQIIFEEEKKKAGLFSRSTLTNLIKTGENKVSALQHFVSSPLITQKEFNKEISNRIEHLIEQGELDQEEGIILLNKLLQAYPEEDKFPVGDKQEQINLIPFQEIILQESIISKYLPSQDDLESLSKQLDELTKKIDNITSNQTKET